MVRTRAEARGIEVVVAEPETFDFGRAVFGALVQYPATDGAIRDFRASAERAHAAGALVTAATDLLALTLLRPPGEWGADIAVGNSQRFGVPMGYGGPHAAFFATRDAYKRLLPGPHHRRLARPRRPAGAPDGAPDARAAHPPRQGDEQRLHRAGAAGGDGEHVRGVSRARRAPPHRRTGPRAHRVPGQRACAGSATGSSTSEYFDTVCVEVAGVGAAPAARRGAGADDQLPAPPANPAVHRAGRDGDRWATWPTSSPSSR